MALKPAGSLCQIREQIIEDVVTGITLQFESRDDGTTRLRLYGDFPFGNRELFFDADGQEAAAGTFMGKACRPSWLKEVTPWGMTSLQRGSLS